LATGRLGLDLARIVMQRLTNRPQSQSRACACSLLSTRTENKIAPIGNYRQQQRPFNSLKESIDSLQTQRGCADSMRYRIKKTAAILGLLGGCVNCQVNAIPGQVPCTLLNLLCPPTPTLVRTEPSVPFAGITKIPISRGVGPRLKDLTT
jgi:hypothetical protein